MARLDAETLRVVALGMAAGHLAQARSEPRSQGVVGEKGHRMPSTLEWRLIHAQVALEWLVTAAEAT